MTALHAHVALGKAPIRQCGAFVAALFLVSAVLAQVPGGGKGKASLHLLEKMASGASQDFIVVYDHSAIEEESLNLQSALGLSAQHRRIVENKAAR